MDQRLAKRLLPYLPELRAGSLVGGELVAGTGSVVTLIDPASGREILGYADAGADVASAATASAAVASGYWRALTASERGRIIWSIGAKIRACIDELAEIETLSTGKPIRDTRAEVSKVAEMFEYYAGWADKIEGTVIPVPTSHLNYVRREPFGVVAQITPWNAPLFTAGWQIAPALAAGNAVVLKPSEWTPLSSLVLGRLIAATDAPRGLVNVLAGLGATTGAALVASRDTDLIVFVGSVETGRKIGELAGKLIKPTVLELGGKSANIVFADADLRHALRGAQAAIFSGAGQSCVAGSRLLLESSIHRGFVERLVNAASQLRFGDPMDPATEMGPLIVPGHKQRVEGLVKEALRQGAVNRSGPVGPGFEAAGASCAPTVLDDVTPAMDIYRDEIFGPVVAVTPFSDEAEAVDLANDSCFGLAGAVWTADPARAHRVASGVRAGTFWINGYKTISVMSPFGGFGQSGYGRSSGREAMMAYTTTKSVWVETAASPVKGFGYD